MAHFKHEPLQLDAADDEAFLAPVELESLAPLEAERHEGARGVAFAATPFPCEIDDAAVAAGVAVGLDLQEQRLAGAPVLLDAQRVGLEGQFQRGMVGRELGRYSLAMVARRCHDRLIWLPEPLAQRVAGQPSAS